MAEFSAPVRNWFAGTTNGPREFSVRRGRRFLAAATHSLSPPQAPEKLSRLSSGQLTGWRFVMRPTKGSSGGSSGGAVHWCYKPSIPRQGARALRVPAQGAGRRRSQESPGSSRGDPGGIRGIRASDSDDLHGCTFGGHHPRLNVAGWCRIHRRFLLPRLNPSISCSPLLPRRFSAR